MKIGEAIKSVGEKLRAVGISDSVWEAELLLGKILHQDRSYLLAHPEKKITSWQNFFFLRLVNRRLIGYSSAVIVGHKWFYGLDFIVNEKVLVPRPETELLVEQIIKQCKNSRQGLVSTWEKKMLIKNIIDVGTGSGCIVVSLVKNLSDSKIKYWALDNSRQALKIARQNARMNGVAGRINFLYSDLLNNIDKRIFKRPTIIAANLPYLSPAQVDNSPSIQKEPSNALLSGPEGLDHYRRLFQQINQRFGLFKSNILLYCEIDESQKNSLAELIKESFSHSRFEFLKDLSGAERLAVIKL